MVCLPCSDATNLAKRAKVGDLTVLCKAWRHALSCGKEASNCVDSAPNSLLLLLVVVVVILARLWGDELLEDVVLKLALVAASSLSSSFGCERARFLEAMAFFFFLG